MIHILYYANFIRLKEELRYFVEIYKLLINFFRKP